MQHAFAILPTLFISREARPVAIGDDESTCHCSRESLHDRIFLASSLAALGRPKSVYVRNFSVVNGEEAERYFSFEVSQGDENRFLILAFSSSILCFAFNLCSPCSLQCVFLMLVFAASSTCLSHLTPKSGGKKKKERREFE